LSRLQSKQGFTLVEVMIVVAVIGVLTAVAAATMPGVIRSWKMKDAANRILEDMREAQISAMRVGDYLGISVGGGEQFRQQQMFVVFDVDAGNYSLQHWVDDNDNGVSNPTDGNGLPDSADNITEVYSRNLPTGVSFNSGPATKSACTGSSNISPLGSQSVTFVSRSYPPCNGNPCIRFDAKGAIDSIGNIYVTDGSRTYAINSLRPGFFRLCMTNGSGWN